MRYGHEGTEGRREGDARTPGFALGGVGLRGFVASWLLLCCGCGRGDDAPPAPAQVTVYCSIDEAFARPILERYGRDRGVEVRTIYDSEAGKTTGLIQRIIREAEAGGPNGDVLWSSEVFSTIGLARMGLLEAYAPPGAADIPPRYKDPRNRWTGYAARARVIAFDPQRTPRSQVPQKWEELAKPEIAARASLANPLFGTTRGHVAAMFARWGHERGRSFLEALRQGGIHLADGNSATVRAVIAGQADFAATDSDDVWVAQRSGASLDLVYPDLGDGGTLLVPCSVAIIRGAPNPAEARKVADFLVSPRVERMLAESEARHVPVRESLRAELRITWPAESLVDYGDVAEAMAASETAVREVLIR